MISSKLAKCEKPAPKCIKWKLLGWVIVYVNKLEVIVISEEVIITNMKKIFKFLKNHIEWVLIISIAFSFISPLIFTRNWSGVDFSETGQIGDTIGGLVSPFLNLLSIILLYLTLKEQIESTTQRYDFDSITSLLSTVKNDFEKLEISLKNSSGKEYKGVTALFEFALTMKSSNDLSSQIEESSLRSFSLSFTFLIANISRLLQKNNSSTVSNEEKMEIYNALKNLRTPILMISDNAEAYIKKVNKSKRSMNEHDKIVQLFPLIKPALLREFESTNPENTSNTK